MILCQCEVQFFDKAAVTPPFIQAVRREIIWNRLLYSGRNNNKLRLINNLPLKGKCITLYRPHSQGVASASIKKADLTHG